MRRLTFSIPLLAASLGLLMPAGATAGRTPVKLPTVTKVVPMRVGVGRTITVYGKNFSARRTRNTVIFRAPNGRTAFSKPRRVSTRKLVLAVPAAVSRLLSRASGVPKPTRFKLRVLSARKYGKYTSRRLSPVIVGTSRAGGPGGGGGGGALVVCNNDGDHDNDLLSNSLELSLKLDPCLSDTDLDGVQDGYEYQAARDLNGSAVPYPGKRPFPNALDSGDASTDYDGDGLLLREEHLLWVRYSSDGVARASGPSSLDNLVYSDGLQDSGGSNPAPAVGSLAAWALNADNEANGRDETHTGQLRDDQRDADGDGLGNWDEQHGRMTEAWWPAQHDGQNEPKESQYPGIDFIDNGDAGSAGDAFADPDLDGDGLADGADDSDHDGVTNQYEVRRPADWGSVSGFFGATEPWAYVNPFNPCKPFDSERCHRHEPFGYYEGDVPIAKGPPRTSATPVQPTTPNG